MLANSSKVTVRKHPGWALISVLAQILRWLAVGGMLVLFLPYVLDAFPGANRHPLTGAVYDMRNSIMRNAAPVVRQYIPTRFAGRDRTGLIMIAGFLVLAGVFGRARNFAEERITTYHLRGEMEEWKQRHNEAAGKIFEREMKKQIQSLDSSKQTNREELLKIFAETKRKLDGMGRDMAFLSVDVVGSTEMKENEDPSVAQIDFDAYRKMVEKVFAARGVIKAAWTPDGVMACFSTVENAVGTGKDIIRSLQHFNSEVKLMKSEFAVRCGVNAGHVYIDESTPLETVSDRAIDIAGHMQKHAERNTVAIARSIAEPLTDVGEFRKSDKVVDGYEVLTWRPERGQVG